MKRIFTYIILSFFFSSPLLATEINFLKVRLNENVYEFEKHNNLKLDNQKNCKKNHCTYYFKHKVPKDQIKYYTNYRLETNENYEIINIVAWFLDRDSLMVPEKFMNICMKEHISWSNDYLRQKYKVGRNQFIDTYFEGKSEHAADHPNILIHSSKLYLDSGKKIFENSCKYSRSDTNKWIISIGESRLMTKDYHDTFELNFPKKKINKFNFDQIKSYLFPSSY